ncbi:Uncharacterized protein APZ42_005645, partial [Daphnia magna]
LYVFQVQNDSQSCEEVSQHKSPSKKAKAKSTKRKKKTRASSRFLERWKQIPEFKTWLQSRHDPSSNISTAYCTACSTYLTNSKKDLQKHSNTQKHILAMETVANCSKESQRLLQYVSSGEDKKVVLATIRLCLLAAEKNLSFNLIDWLIPTSKASFPDHLILEKVMMSRTKCSVMRFGEYSLIHLYFENKYDN